MATISNSPKKPRKSKSFLEWLKTIGKPMPTSEELESISLINPKPSIQELAENMKRLKLTQYYDSIQAIHTYLHNSNPDIPQELIDLIKKECTIPYNNRDICILFKKHGYSKYYGCINYIIEKML